MSRPHTLPPRRSVHRRVALLGAGLAAGPHLAALYNTGCEVVSVATRSEERAARVHALFPDARRCWPPEDALDGANLALVLSPPHTHLDLVRAAAERGIDVLVEKPLEVSLARGESLVRTASDAGIGLAVCFQHRAKPAGQCLRDLLADAAQGGRPPAGGGEPSGGSDASTGRAALGAFVGGAIRVPWWRPQAYYDEPGRGTYARDGGGALITQAVHILDLFLWAVGRVAGAPRQVVALAGTSALHSMEAEDAVGALLDYGAGRVVTLHATTAAYPGGEDEITINGTLGTAHLRGTGLDVHGPDGTRTLVTPSGTATAADPSLMPGEWHQAVLDDALDAFVTGREPLAGGQSALLTQRVIAAVYRAASERRWIDLDDERLTHPAEAADEAAAVSESDRTTGGPA